MKKIFLLLTISFSLVFNSFSQDLSQPKGGGTLDIVLVSPGDGYTTMNFEGQISGYGSVFVKFKLSSINTSKTSGTLDGQGRTILEDGTLITTPLKGTWKRNKDLIRDAIDDILKANGKLGKIYCFNQSLQASKKENDITEIIIDGVSKTIASYDQELDQVKIEEVKNYA